MPQFSNQKLVAYVGAEVAKIDGTDFFKFCVKFSILLNHDWLDNFPPEIQRTPLQAIKNN